jgi:hypothetical protein
LQRGRTRRDRKRHDREHCQKVPTIARLAAFASALSRHLEHYRECQPRFKQVLIFGWLSWHLLFLVRVEGLVLVERLELFDNSGAIPHSGITESLWSRPCIPESGSSSGMVQLFGDWIPSRDISDISITGIYLTLPGY